MELISIIVKERDNMFTADNHEISYKELLAIKVKESPDHEMFNFAGKDYTWSDVDKLSTIIAHDLSKMGVHKGSHVGICGRNSINWVLTFFAIQKLGAVAVLINFNLKSSELVDIVHIGDITHLCFGDASPNIDPTHYDKYIAKVREDSTNAINCAYSFSDTIDFSTRLAELPYLPTYEDVEVKYNDPAVMIFTSGSTGSPKGALHNSYTLIHSAYISFCKNHFTSEDRECFVLPLFHIFGLVQGFTGCMLSDSKIYILAAPKTVPILDTISNYKCTIFISVPSVFLAMMNNPTFAVEKVLSVKYSLIGGAPITETQMTLLAEKFPNTAFAIGYGLSEMDPVSFTLFGDTLQHLCHTIGIPLDTIQVKIQNINTLEDCAPNEEGEILAKGPNQMLGYYNIPDVNQPIDRDGWLHTGDFGVMDEEGYISLTGRMKEIIIRGGENITPLEIATALTALDGIADAKVLPVPSYFWGEEVGAGIVLEDGATFDEEKVKAELKNVLADFKIPSYFFVYDKFPMLSNGKVDAVTLRKEYAEKAKELAKK